MLEAIRHGLGRTVDPQLDAVAFDFLDAGRFGITRELRHHDRWIVDSGSMAAAQHGDPDLALQLRGQLMELQHREQKEHGLRDLGGDDHLTLVFGRLGVRQTIQAATDLLQLASRGQIGGAPAAANIRGS
jgi:hypothetical protein